MTSPSPAEFLTFMRHVVVRYSVATRPSFIAPGRRGHQVLGASSVRRLSASAARFTDTSTGTNTSQKPHTTEKNDRLDVQADNAHSGKEARVTDQGGTATQQKDSRNSQQRAKDEHPEAPVTIGMQDERGGKGY